MKLEHNSLSFYKLHGSNLQVLGDFYDQEGEEGRSMGGREEKKRKEEKPIKVTDD
jgi:hypothetical protein